MRTAIALSSQAKHGFRLHEDALQGIWRVSNYLTSSGARPCDGRDMKVTNTMIREYQSEDADAVVSIWREATALAHPFLKPEFVAQETDNLRNIYLKFADTSVMEQNGTVVGFIALIEDEIGGLFLQPSFHGRGLGRTLVDHAVALKGPLRVEVFAQNAIGRRFYQKYGFADCGEYLHENSGEQTLKLAMAAT